MWWIVDITAIALVVISLLVISVIVLRKFPQLTLIDTESLPMERDAAKKKEIIRERAERVAAAHGRRVRNFAVAIFERAQERFRHAYRRLLILERQYRMEKPATPEAAADKIATLLDSARTAQLEGEFEVAEKRYIEVLSMNLRSHDAYWGLGALYLEAKRYEESKETFAYLVRMLRKESRCVHNESGAPGERACEASAEAHADIAMGWFDAGLAASAGGDVSYSRQAFERAVAFGPANPRHLDLLIEACIMEGDKSRAAQVFAQMQAANPENNKLESMAERIAALPDPQQRKKGKIRFVMASREEPPARRSEPSEAPEKAVEAPVSEPPTGEQGGGD